MQGGRRKAREILFRALYESEVGGEDLREALEYSLGRYHLREDARDHVVDLAAFLAQHRAEIDRRLQKQLAHWALDRVSLVVRSILRLASAELMISREIPVEVILDQAIRLAHRYGEEGAASFVNGVLDPIAAELRPEEERPARKSSNAESED
jgi:N utilization substance protein B